MIATPLCAPFDYRYFLPNRKTKTASPAPIHDWFRGLSIDQWKIAMTIIDPYFIDMIIAMRKILTKIDSPGIDTFPFFAYKERRLDDLSSKESFTEDDFYHWIPYASEFSED